MKTRTILLCGGKNTQRIAIGGKSPISVQTMWKESLHGILCGDEHFFSILRQIENLKSLGCDILRFAIPDKESAIIFNEISKESALPLVADIHFDYRLALECAKGSCAAIRINPGNIGKIENLKKVADACRESGKAIRIGVNSGSLSYDLRARVEKNEISLSQALCESALREASFLDEIGFSSIVVSIKSSSVNETIEANQAFAKKSNIPLHLGVTEAGPLVDGIVKSSIAFYELLKNGIGSTIRVSLSAPCESEVLAGCAILKECGLRKGGIRIVSCPRCGRNGFDVHSFVERWQNRFAAVKKNLVVAVMGCAVNGPGEAKNADLGITGADGNVVIFKNGKIIRTTQEKNADNIFEEEFKKIIAEN